MRWFGRTKEPSDATWRAREQPLRSGAIRSGRDAIGSFDGMDEVPILQIKGLDVYYGRAHALQDISFGFDHGVLAIVGRNGMGKTTLCNAITGLVPGRGSIAVAGHEVLGRPANEINRLGVGYVPQGRRVWPSLTVDEHLRLAAGTSKGAWDIARVYRTFPRLAERKSNGGSQLSGGEQQMLAIARALLFNPRLLVMDEPTEGLAPVIVQQVASMLKSLAADGEIAVLLVEQNLGVAIDVADQVAVMVNGRIARRMAAGELAADVDLQHRLLGVRSGPDEDDEADDAAGTSVSSANARSSTSSANLSSAPSSPAADADADDAVRIYTVRRADDMPGMPVDRGNFDSPGGDHVADTARAGAPAAGNDSAGSRTVDDEPRAIRALNRWNAGDARATAPLDRLIESRAEPPRSMPAMGPAAEALSRQGRSARVIELPVSATIARAAYVAGTFDTKARELFFIRNCLEKLGLRTVTVDLSTTGKPSPAMIHPREVARHHPQGERAIFTGDRGTAVSAMAVAFEHFVSTRRDLGGLISAGGSGGTALATAAMRRLPIGVPKLMVSTVASGDVRAYVGPSDICMMYSVTDVAGINRISERVLSNAAHALAGMITHARFKREGERESDTRVAIGLTMFGVTTTCVQAVSQQFETRYDCLTFHATGTGGQSMEKLAESGLLGGVLDITTTEICDEIVGGVLSAGDDRLGVFARRPIPYVGSCGALDMVNFWAHDTVPAKFRTRNLYRHNPNVTLMRTTVDECRRIGQFIVDRLNAMAGPVRFLIPEGGVSALDAPGQPFWDPAADKVLFDTIAAGFRSSGQHQLLRLPHHLNDPAFADALVKAFDEVMTADVDRAHRRRSH